MSEPSDVRVLLVGVPGAVASETLEGRGFAVEAATDAEEALDRLADHEFDCVVSGHELPRMDGTEFVGAAREDHPAIPVVLFSDRASEKAASEALSAGATDYLLTDPTADQSERLANRIRNAVERSRARQRAAELDRVRSLVHDVNRALVRAGSRADAETRVCEIISESDPYVFAWIGDHDADTQRVEPRTGAGIEQGYLDAIEITTDGRPTGQGPTARAVRTGDVAVMQDIPENPEYEPWREEALERGYRSSAAVPLVHDGSLYGVLNVYADRTRAFDERERELLEELGTNIAHALHSFEVQARLRAERDRYTTLFENLPNPVVCGRLQDGEARISDVNPAFEETFGHDADAVVDEALHEFVQPPAEERELDPEALIDRLRAGEDVQVDVRRATADGLREFRVDVTLRNPGAGIPEGYAIYTDITERIEREHALERLHEATRDLMTATSREEVARIGSEAATEILELSRNGIHLYDVDADALVPVAWAESSEELLGGPPPALPVEDSVAGRAYRTGTVETHADVRTADEVFDADTPFRSELCLPLGEHGVLILSSTETDGFDATDRALGRVLAANVEAGLDRVAQRRELRRERDRLDEFASIVSHDLRNPLNVAAGRLALAREDCESEHLDSVARAHDRMGSLIDDLLTLAREGERVSEPERVDLAATAEGCWRTIGTAGATLVAETAGVIRADPARLKQLLENLFRNAVEHGSTANQASSDDAVEHGSAGDGASPGDAGDDATVWVGDLADGFYVADDGPGIPADERERVFEAGYSTADDGIGLGLNIVREIVEAHGWEIAVTESRAGGTRFEITGVDLVAE